VELDSDQAGREFRAEAQERIGRPGQPGLIQIKTIRLTRRRAKLSGHGARRTGAAGITGSLRLPCIDTAPGKTDALTRSWWCSLLRARPIAGNSNCQDPADHDPYNEHPGQTVPIAVWAVPVHDRNRLATW